MRRQEGLPLIGLGLLEAVPEETILQLAARAPVDGIGRHANRVWDESQGKTVLGRFGSKATGRARNFTEAILWHGGEAQAAREAFRKLTHEDREALLAFLRSR